MIQNKTIMRGLIALILIFAVGMSACNASPVSTSAPAGQAPTATSQSVPVAGPVRLKDGRGVEVTLEKPAERIISLAPAITEIVFALEAGGQMVGRDAYSDYPEEVKSVTDIGGGFSELNMEAILAQKPDLVLAGSLTGDEQIQALQGAGLTVFVLDNPKEFSGMYANLRTVAVLVGQEPVAESLIADLEKRVAVVEEKLAGVTDRPLVFYEIDGTDPNAPWTSGPGSYIDVIINMAGGDNLGASLQDEWAQINLEELIARDPDIILLGDAVWGDVTVESAAARSGWEALGAVKAGQMFPFDDNLVARPGPRMVDGLEALAKLLHPDLFK